MTLKERFENKFIKGCEDECWEWMASISTPGYGQIGEGGRKGRNLGAHRVSYELYKGIIPEGLVVDHICGNRKCVNPNHLRLLTRSENVMIADTICARKVNSTHCPNGHEYTEENTYLYKSIRMCRTCRRKNDAKRRGNGRKFKDSGSNGAFYRTS